MGNPTAAELTALKNYVCELESFRARINSHCNYLDRGISSCSGYMLDKNSRNTLQKGRQVSKDIRECLYQVDILLERANRKISVKEEADEIDY